MKLLLTGGCGFIGSAVVRRLIRHSGHVVVNVDKMTYAASKDALQEACDNARHIHVRADITDATAMRQVFGNVSDLRFLISTLLIVSGVFPQRCALIVPCIDHESIRRLVHGWSAEY